MSEKHQIRWERKKKRRKQKRKNLQLKKKLFGHLFMAPCCYCKKVFMLHDLTVEHLNPLCLGGTNEEVNIDLACAPCNHERGKVAWHQKQNSPEYLEFKRKHYEQYSPEHSQQNRERSLQTDRSSTFHHQGESI